MKKLLAGLIVVIAVGAAAYYYMNANKNGTETDTTPPAAMDSEADPRVSAAAQMLVGTWSSEDDRNFNREYKNDGTVVDSYASVDGEETTEGTWTLFTSDTDEQVEFQLNNQDVYIKQTDDAGPLYFRIVSVTPTELELVYMNGNGFLRFGKMTTGYEMRDGQEMELSASFNCEDGSHFVAEFPTMETLVTVVDGNITGTLPLVPSDAGKRYENGEWIYTFQGETAKAEHKVTTNITSCAQPFDANNAPVNFGD